MSILTRDNIPSFADPVSMQVVEECNLVQDSNKGNSETKGKAPYNSVGTGKGRGHGRFGSTRANNNYQGRGQQIITGRNNMRGRGSNRGRGKKHYVSDDDCWYCGNQAIHRLDVIKGKMMKKREKRQQNMLQQVKTVKKKVLL